MSAPRQTLKFLIERFQEAGIHPETKHGQNFLIDLNLQHLLVNAADLTPLDVVLEVGTGTGALTALMAQKAAGVLTIEIDARMHQLAREQLEPFPNVTMLLQDALKNKNHFQPNVLEILQGRLDAVPGRRLKLVANLPYNIATPVVSNMLSTGIIPHSMIVTIQKELADRMIAPPRTKDYGALSIWMQCQCRMEIVRVMPPSVFWPRPKVNSAIIRIEPDAEMRARLPDPNFFHTFVKAMFIHRRKFLRSGLLSAVKGKLDKPAVDEILAERQIGPDARSEQLTVEEMMALAEAVRQRIPPEE